MINHQFFPEDTTDFYPILTKAIAANPDMIVIGLGNPGNVPVIIKQARELGWKGPMGLTQGSVGSATTALKIAGEAAEGFIYTTPSHGDRQFLSKQENEWMDYFLKRWGVLARWWSTYRYRHLKGEKAWSWNWCYPKGWKRFIRVRREYPLIKEGP